MNFSADLRKHFELIGPVDRKRKSTRFVVKIFSSFADGIEFLVTPGESRPHSLAVKRYFKLVSWIEELQAPISLVQCA